jgi:hypothetical protein
MVWAGICHDGRTQLKIVQVTLNAVKYSSIGDRSGDNAGQ